MSTTVFRLLFVLWAGSLWSTVWVALTIFQSQPDRHLSGVLAARLFGIETYLGAVVAIFAIVRGKGDRFRFGFAATAMLLFNEWAVKAVMDQALTRGSAFGIGFGPWHGISALLYLLACVMVAVEVCRYEFGQNRRAVPQAQASGKRILDEAPRPR